METKYYTTTEKEALRKRFLYIPKEFKKYMKNENIFWIYKLINFHDDRIYVGKTRNIHRRSLNYVNEYLKGDMSREITRALNDLGLNNFMMIPLEVALTEKSAEIKERYYIDLYDSIENGFNSILSSAPSHSNRKRPSVPQTLYARMIKSKLVCGISTSKKMIVFSTGLKLFGDYIGRSKDEVKSAAKRETRLEGYFIYYMNLTDFTNQLIDAESKIKKNSTYDDYRLQYHDFVKYASYLKSLLKTKENPEKFEIKFITQDNGEPGYKFDDVEKFDNYYLNATNRII